MRYKYVGDRVADVDFCTDCIRHLVSVYTDVAVAETRYKLGHKEEAKEAIYSAKLGLEGLSRLGCVPGIAVDSVEKYLTKRDFTAVFESLKALDRMVAWACVR
jgi:hypothetical protein